MSNEEVTTKKITSTDLQKAILAEAREHVRAHQKEIVEKAKARLEREQREKQGE